LKMTNCDLCFCILPTSQNRHDGGATPNYARLRPIAKGERTPVNPRQIPHPCASALLPLESGAEKSTIAQSFA
jgi:hypothetical protein